MPELSVRLNPSQSLSSINVDYSWASASPYTLEREVTAVLEGGFSTIQGLEKLSSRSSKGNGIITLEFDKYTDIDVVRFEVATIIRQLYKNLPERLTYPVIRVNRPDDEIQRPFLSYSINAAVPALTIQETAKNIIEPVIGTLQDVDKVQIYGANQKEYVLRYKEFQLKQLKISKQELIIALNNYFKRESLGQTTYGDQFITLSLSSRETVDWHIPIRLVAGRMLYLDQLVEVGEQEQETHYYYRANGKNAINLAITATKNANTIALAKEVDKKLQELKKSFPASYTLVQNYDATEYLSAELDKIYQRSFYTVLILLLFILMVSRSFNYLLVTLLCLVVNLGLAFSCYYIFGVEIQLYSLAGITISLGLIMDNIIVMIDHIQKRGNQHIFIPILAATLTTVGALSIIYFLDEKYRLNLIDFALVIIINLAISLVISLFLVPALLEKIRLKPNKEIKIFKKWSIGFYRIYGNTITFLLRFKKGVIIILVLTFGLPIFMLPQRLDDTGEWYQKTYNSTIGAEWYKENLRPYLDRYLGGSLRLFSQYVFDNAYYGRNEETKLFVNASMEKGATIHQMNEAILILENYLLQFTEIKQFSITIGSGDFGRMEILFKEDSASGTFPFILKARLIRKALDLGGIDWNIYGVGNGFSNGGASGEPVNFTVEAIGYNYDELNVWANTLKGKLLSHPRIQKVLVRENSYYARESSYEYRFKMDKERLALTETTPAEVFTELSQLTLSKYEDVNLTINGKYTPVRFESDASATFDIWDIKNSPLDSLDTPIVLKDIARISKEREEENIYKVDQEYIRLVEFQYTGAAKFGSKFLNEQLEELEKRLPLGYQFKRRGYQFNFGEDENGNYLFLLILITGIIYLICSILFESLKQPFVILSVVPISFIGVFLTFYIFDFNFDQGGLASFVLLSGITVNASIFIIDGFNKLRKEHPGQNKVEQYIQAFRQKIFPIILTVVSTILGFVPFIKDGQNEVFWFALGVGTIGGLLFSLLGILWYLPLFLLKKLKSNN